MARIQVNEIKQRCGSKRRFCTLSGTLSCTGTSKWNFGGGFYAPMLRIGGHIVLPVCLKLALFITFECYKVLWL